MTHDRQRSSALVRLLVDELKWFDDAIASGRLDDVRKDQCREARALIFKALQFVGQMCDSCVAVIDETSATLAKFGEQLKGSEGRELNPDSPTQSIGDIVGAAERNYEHTLNVLDHHIEQVEGVAAQIDALANGIRLFLGKDEGTGQQP